MKVTEIEITLLEKVFFASREVDKFFLTEPVIGNYALAYAMGWIGGPYHSEKVRNETPLYKEHLSRLNDQKIYITPATPIGEPKMELERFNALVDTYWYQMSNNAVVGDLEVKVAGKRPRTANFPQEGRMRLLSRGNRFRAFILHEQVVTINPYIRLGKWLSKARVEIINQWQDVPLSQENQIMVEMTLNPLDISQSCTVHLFNLINIPPVPLIQRAYMSGSFLKLGEDKYLPSLMNFGGLEELA